jgi:predicted transcriptional regulator
MVGALSIVRFRTAIKDSRDSTYIFWTIIIGICCGVGDYMVAAIGSTVTFLVILVLGMIKNDNRMLLIIRAAYNRQDIIQALQQTQKQPQFGETVDNLTLSGFKLGDTVDNKITIQGNVTQFMMNECNFASSGALTMIISNASTIAARKLYRLQNVVDEMHLIRINPVVQDEEIFVTVELLQNDKKYCKAEVVVRSAEELKYKAHMILKVQKK